MPQEAGERTRWSEERKLPGPDLSMMTMLLRQVQLRMMGAILLISSGLHIRHLTCRTIA